MNILVEKVKCTMCTCNFQQHVIYQLKHTDISLTFGSSRLN